MARRIWVIPAMMSLGLAVVLTLMYSDSPRAFAHQTPDRVTVDLDEIDDSGVTGTAVLQARGDRTLVVLDVVGTAGVHPDHIHRSTCDDPEPNPLFPLTDIVLDESDAEGHSETLVDVPLEELLAEPHLILIHKSSEEISVYVACGNIVANDVAMPETGGGMAATDRSSRLWVLVVGAALLAGIAGLMHAVVLPDLAARRSRTG